MSEKPENPSAFPVMRQHYVTGEVIGTTGGMTLRDYFAAAALQGMYAHGSSNYAHGENANKERAEGAYAQADAMLEARA